MLDVSPILLVAALASPPAPPQPTPTATDTVLASVVSPLVHTGDRVRVRIGGAAVEGSAGWIGPSGLVLAPAYCNCTTTSKIEMIPWSRIDGIDRRSRHGSNAAKVGTTVGCLVGLAMGMSVGAYSSGLDNGTADGTTALFAGVTGAIAGACVGGIIGGAISVATRPSWTTVFERR